MVNSLKMKDGPPVIVLGPLGQLEGAPVDEAVVAGKGGHHLERKDYCRLSSCPERSSESINLSIKIMGDYRLVHYHLEKKDYRRLSTCQMVHKDYWRLAPCPQRFYTCIVNWLKSYPREGRLDTKGDHDPCVEERRNWIRRSYDGKVPYSWEKSFKKNPETVIHSAL